MSNRDEMPMTTSSQGKIAKPSGLGDAPDHVVPEPTEAMVEAGVKRINATANLGHTIEERIALAAEATIAAAPPEWLLRAALSEGERCEYCNRPLHGVGPQLTVEEARAVLLMDEDVTRAVLAPRLSGRAKLSLIAQGEKL